MAMASDGEGARRLSVLDRMDSSRSVDTQQLADEFEAWSLEKIRSAKTVTGVAVARLVYRCVARGIDKHGLEAEVKASMKAQMDVWSQSILMDSILLAVLAPLVIYEEMEFSEGAFSEGVGEVLTWAYIICVSLAFFLTLLHGGMTTLLYTTTCYVTDCTPFCGSNAVQSSMR